MIKSASEILRQRTNETRLANRNREMTSRQPANLPDLPFVHLAVSCLRWNERATGVSPASIRRGAALITTSRENAFLQLFAPAAGERVRWRLLSGNNREVGRSLRSYADEAAARADLVSLRDEVEQLQRQIRRNSEKLWFWQLLRGDEPVVASSREYDRMIRCEHALRSFLIAMQSASINDSVLVSNSRRWDSRLQSPPHNLTGAS
jgi:hypothetical protein